MTLEKERKEGYYSDTTDSSENHCPKVPIETEKQSGKSILWGEICVSV